MTAQIINFTAELNKRRASGEIAAKTEREAERVKAEMKEFCDMLGVPTTGPIFGQAFETAAKDIAKENMEKEKPYNMPAYCDPSNEYKGAKYESTQNLDIKDIAKLVRKDIKEAQKRGDIPKGAKFSVRIDRYSMGQSLDVRLKEFDGPLFSSEFVKVTENFTNWTAWNDYCRFEVGENVSKFTPEVNKAVEAAQDVLESYNRDNSDAMTDYFDVRFYGDASVSWELESQRQEVEKV